MAGFGIHVIVVLVMLGTVSSAQPLYRSAPILTLPNQSSAHHDRFFKTGLAAVLTSIQASANSAASCPAKIVKMQSHGTDESRGIAVEKASAKVGSICTGGSARKLSVSEPMCSEPFGPGTGFSCVIEVMCEYAKPVCNPGASRQ